MFSAIQQLSNQLQAKDIKKGVYVKRTQVEARVLMSKEGRSELQQLYEEVHLKEAQQAEDAAWKATEDDA